MNQSLLVKSSVLTQRTINLASNSSIYNGSGDGSAEMPLVEECQDLVSGLETSHALTNGFDCAGSIGGGDDAVADWEGVFALQM